MHKQKLHSLAMSLALAGVGATPMPVSAAILEFDWTGNYTMLNRLGAALINSSINVKLASQYQTPISGTLTLDTDAGSGSMTIAPFDWQNQDQTLPATFHDIEFELIGDGFGGTGTLALGNMLYDWNGTNDLSVSIVWDMSGLLAAVGSGLSLGDLVAGTGAVPASDGTYTPNNGPAYLGQGPAPVATTTYNTTLVPDCGSMDCKGLVPSGTLPLVIDTVYNEYKSTETEQVYGVGGSPIMDGPWADKNFNIDITLLSVTNITPVPLPPALWLLGSGLAVLAGVSQGRKRRNDKIFPA